MRPPSVDSKGVQYTCDGCSLNLHAYTERRDRRDQYSSAASSGLILAIGNVGHSLGPYLDGRTFFSRDAGESWTELTDDAYMVEFGDSGAIFILANDETPTDTIRYILFKNSRMLIRKVLCQFGQRNS